MIIVATNRKLPPFNGAEKKTINVDDMGVSLGDNTQNGHRTYFGELINDSQVEFYEQGKELELFDAIQDNEKRKPWVFFVHGFHQDPDENIKKAKALSKNHNVNVINFAWPSKPYDKKYTLDEAKKDVVKSAIKGIPFKSIATMAGYKLVKGYINDMWDNYIPATQNAEKSDADLLYAMKKIDDDLHLKNKPTLLVHSMGNYLLQNTVNTHNKLSVNFNNIVLHQADVDSPGYEWVHNLNENLVKHNDAAAQSRLYITTNAPDYVLCGSSIRRTILNLSPSERLGQTRLHYMPGDIHYLDFTSAPGIDNDHEPFKRGRAVDYEDTDWSERIDSSIFDVLGRIFRAEPDELPTQPKETKSGLVKMPTDVHLYRAQWLIHPADGNHPDEGDLVSPLNM